jgi:hypothetical protein
MVNVRAITALRLLSNDLARLAFRADKKNLAPVCSHTSEKIQRVPKHRQGPLEVNDMDLVPRPENVGSHFRRPEPCLVAKVHARL